MARSRPVIDLDESPQVVAASVDPGEPLVVGGADDGGTTPEGGTGAGGGKDGGDGGGKGRSKGLGRTALWSALSNLALPITSLMSGPILAHTLGPEQRGEMTAAVVPVFVLMFVANLGLPEATTYGIAALRQNPKVVFWAVARVSVLAGVLTGAVLWWYAPLVLRQAPDSVAVLRQVVFLLPLLMLVIILRFAVTGMREFRAVNFERVFTPVLRLAGFVGLLAFGALTVQSAALAQVIATVLGGCVLFIALRRSKTDPQELAEPDPHLTRSLTGYGVRGWGAVFGNLVNWRLDQLILAAIASPIQLGYYVVAVHFSEIPATAVNAVRKVLFAESAHGDDLTLIARATRIVVLLTTIGAIVVAIPAYWLIKIVFGSGFTPATQMAQLLLFATIPFCIEQVVSAGLLAKGVPGRRSVGQGLSAGVTVAGLLVLTPIMGAMGAAVTSLVAYTLNASIAVWQFHRVSGMSVASLLVPRVSDLSWMVRKLRRRGRKGGRKKAAASTGSDDDRDHHRAREGPDNAESTSTPHSTDTPPLTLTAGTVDTRHDTTPAGTPQPDGVVETRSSRRRSTGQPAAGRHRGAPRRPWRRR